jgi:Protein of unknown function (DUF3592)
LGLCRGPLVGMGAGAQVFFALVGVVEIALGADWISTHRYLVEHGTRTRGVVMANHRSVYKGSPTYSPQVRYAVPHGQTYVVEGEGRPTPQFRVGESVTVYYDPLDPETALVYDADTDSIGWVFIIAGGLTGLLACPWPLLWRLLRRTPTPTRQSTIRPPRSSPARRRR